MNHFVASKRSLNTQTVLWRANEIVNTARELLEENAVLAAKNSSIRNIVDEQVDALEAVRRGIDVVEAEVQTEFKVLFLLPDLAMFAHNEHSKSCMTSTRPSQVASLRSLSFAIPRSKPSCSLLARPRSTSLTSSTAQP